MSAIYDQSTTIFSPEGRIFQVEYATKAVEGGETIVGIKCKDGVLIGAEKQMLSKLQLANSSKRLYTLDNTIGCAITGRIPDGRHIINRCRQECSNYEKQFGIEMPVKVLADRIGLYIHAYTLYGSYRPFGSSTIMAGWDNHKGYQLFMLDVAGNSYGYKSVVQGKAKQIVKTQLEKIDFQSLTCKQALIHLAKMLILAHEDIKDKIFELEMSWVCDETNHFVLAVPSNLKEEAENQALAQIEAEQNQ